MTKPYRKPETDPETIRHGCWVCGVDCGVGEAGQVAWAEHSKGDDHFENVRDQQYQSARNMGMQL